MKMFFALFTLFYILSGNAQIVSVSQPLSPDIPPWAGGFVVPNEMAPGDLKSIFSNLPSGVVVSIGSERSFFDLVMAKEGSSLITIDVDPYILRYNKMIVECFITNVYKRP